MIKFWENCAALAALGCMLLTLSKKNSDSAVDEDTLLHGETLLVVTAGDSKSVTIELFSQNVSVDVGSHSSIVELTTANDENKGQLGRSAEQEHVLLT